jgi:hypothetical protein
MNKKKIFNMAEKAYMKGLTQEDNPFDETLDNAEFEAWRIGWHEESVYWELTRAGNDEGII